MVVTFLFYYENHRKEYSLTNIFLYTYNGKIFLKSSVGTHPSEQLLNETITISK
jgi:hypothetical protein